ncbi:type-4 uracil-DNA glycosylase [Methanoculleus sp.]|uniref:type-4 uracil-DNA glycosylase n=1 Tax=Methanoculleus sp. TaxID=90427 RepID=UPI00272EB0DF|nr:type-4 uracil-DNA glycosylase [Methanoculleus sp.]
MERRQDRREQMDELAAAIRECRRCPLWKDARHAVPGEGNIDAQLLFVGEAPGQREDLTGRPFVGRAGALLEELLAGIGLSRGDVFIANIVKHRPPGNRDPRESEVAACTPYLERQIRLIGPAIIATLGRHSSRYILSKVPVDFERITDIRGRIYAAEVFGRAVRIIPTVHPAAALYNPRYRAMLEEDFRTIEEEIRRLPDTAATPHSQG